MILHYSDKATHGIVLFLKKHYTVGCTKMHVMIRRKAD